MGRKIGGQGSAPLGEEELGRHLTQCGQGPALPYTAKFHLDPSNRLATIHKCHRQAGQTDRADRQRPDSIGRTVLQTGAQKTVMLKRNGPVMKSMDSVLRPEESLWHCRCLLNNFALYASGPTSLGGYTALTLTYCGYICGVLVGNQNFASTQTSFLS